MAVIPSSRRRLLMILIVAVAGIAAIRYIGKVKLEKAIRAYETKGGSMSVLGPAGVPKQQNMATWLAAGVQVLDMDAEDRGFLREIERKNVQHLDESSLKRIQRLVDQNAMPIQILMRAAPLKQSSLNLHYSDYETPIPNLLEYLQASLLMGGKWRLDLHNNDLGAASQTALLQERFAAALTHERIPITGLIGHVAERDFYEFLQRTIAVADENLLRAEIEQIKHLQSMATPIDRIIAIDGSMLYRSLSKRFLDDDYFEQERVPATRRISLMTSYALNRSYFLANLLENYSELVDYARKPAPETANSSFDQTWIAAMFFSSNLETLLRRYQGMDAARHLAATAVQMRLQGLQDRQYKKPSNLPKSSYSGETAQYRVLSDGSVELSFPETIRLWESKFPKTPPERPRLSWILPAL